MRTLQLNIRVVLGGFVIKDTVKGMENFSVIFKSLIPVKPKLTIPGPVPYNPVSPLNPVLLFCSAGLFNVTPRNGLKETLPISRLYPNSK